MTMPTDTRELPILYVCTECDRVGRGKPKRDDPEWAWGWICWQDTRVRCEAHFMPLKLVPDDMCEVVGDDDVTD